MTSVQFSFSAWRNFIHFPPRIRYALSLKMEVICFFQTLAVTHKTTRRHDRENKWRSVMLAMLALLTVWETKNKKSSALFSWFFGTPFTGTQQNRPDKLHSNRTPASWWRPTRYSGQFRLSINFLCFLVYSTVHLHHLVSYGAKWEDDWE